MGQAAPKNDTLTEDEEAELLLKRLNIYTDQRDALDALIKADKTRLRAIMEEAGDRNRESDYYGAAGFTPRRNFKVIDREVLVKRCSKAFLAEGWKPTAAAVDALAQKGVSIDGMVSIGLNEQFVYRRPADKEATARRRSIINESKDRMRAKVEEILTTL